MRVWTAKRAAFIITTRQAAARGAYCSSERHRR
jgi:hypothetical protein